MKRFILLNIALILCNILGAQQTDYISIAGKIIDSSTQDPIYLATVLLKGTNISNVSNSEGVFVFKLPADTPDTAQIVMSCLGYDDLTLNVGDFASHNVDKPLLLPMITAVYHLPGAVVGLSNAEVLIDQAYRTVRKNYPTEHIGMTAFYRELIKKGNLKYLSLSEAVLDIDKAPYLSLFDDKAGIYKGRGVTNYDATDSLMVKYQAGVNTSLAIDLVKNPFAGIDPIDLFNVYSYEIIGSAVQDDRIFTVVSFTQRPEYKDIYFRGKLYIDPITYAIGRIEFNMNVEGRDDAVQLFMVKAPLKYVFSVDEASYIVNFREVDEKWYYEYAKIGIKFSTRRRFSPFTQHYSISSELAVTDFAPGQIEIKNESRFRLNDQLSDKLADFTDDEFWENYNVIEPDASVDAIVNRIVRQLRRHYNDRPVMNP